MRNRSKKIVLVQSINSNRTEKESKFIEHKDEVIPMRIYHHQIKGEGHLAQIFYQALLNEPLTHKNTNQLQRHRSFKSTTLQTDASQKPNNYGKIVRRSLSKNCSQSSTPEKTAVQIVSNRQRVRDSSKEVNKVQFIRKISVLGGGKQNKTLYSSVQKIQSSRRSVSNKKQIKYKVKPAVRS